MDALGQRSAPPGCSWVKIRVWVLPMRGVDVVQKSEHLAIGTRGGVDAPNHKGLGISDEQSFSRRNIDALGQRSAPIE